MNKISFIILVLLLSTSIFGIASNKIYANNLPNFGLFLDDEYDKFRREGDAFFKQANYKKALNKYRSCLEVPNFSNDTYANAQVIQCQRAIKLTEDSDIALSKKKNEKALEYLKELMLINPNDNATKKKLGNLWITSGLEKYGKSLFQEAINDYKQALEYDFDQREIEQLIKNSEDRLTTLITKPSPTPIDVLQKKIIPKLHLPNSTKSPLLKITVGILGVGTGLYALKLNNDWHTKLSEIDKAYFIQNYTSYLTAYDNASKFQSSQSFRNICVGIAVTSAIAEAYLFIHKPKKQKTSILPSNNSIGLTLNYKF